MKKENVLIITLIILSIVVIFIASKIKTGDEISVDETTTTGGIGDIFSSIGNIFNKLFPKKK